MKLDTNLTVLMFPKKLLTYIALILMYIVANINLLILLQP